MNNFHLLNRLSIYTDPYMLIVKTEYWTGFRRKKIATFFNKYTIWIRE